MNIEEKEVLDLSQKSKDELIDEVLKLKKQYEFNNQLDPIEGELDSELSKLIVDNSHDGIIIINEQNKIEYVNNRTLELTGKTKEEVINKDFRRFLSKDNSQEVIKRHESRLRGESLNSSFEMSIPSKSGERKVFEIRSTVFQDSLGNLKTLSQLKDITERKITEEAIKQSEEKFRSIVEHSHLGILIVGMDYCFEYVNAQLCKILGSTKKEIEGSDFRNYLSKESLDLVAERYKQRQMGISVPSEYNITLLRSDGEKRIGKLRSTTISFSGKIKTIAQILDITEIVKKENLRKTLLKISQAVNEVENLTEFLTIVQSELSIILDTKNFYVAFYNNTTESYTFPYIKDEFDHPDQFTQLDLKDSLTDYVRKTNQAILVNDEIQDKLEKEGEIEGIVGERSPVWIGVPLVVDNLVVGVMALQNYHNPDAYNDNDLEVLKIVSENVSSAIWKKQVVDKLTENETRYRDFISHSSEGIYRVDFDPPISIALPKKEQVYNIIKYGSIGECNNSYAKMYGLKSYKDIVGKNLNFFYGNKISDKNFNANITFIENNYKVTDVETIEQNSEGEEIRILNNSIGIVKDGFLQNIWGIQKDITESKKLQTALQQVAEGISSSTGDFFFKSLVKFLGETLNIDFTFIAEFSENGKSADSLAFWGKNEMKGNFSYLLKDSLSQYIIEQKKTTVIPNIDDRFPDDILLKQLRIQNYMGRPLVNSDGKAIGIIVILQQSKIKNIDFTKSVLEIFASRSSAEIERLQDVKEIVAAKENAERSNNLKSDFLAQMSHEIRTPVNTILSFTSLLKENLEHQLDEELKDSFKIIENGGQRLIRTIDLILNVSQIQSGSLDISPSNLNLVAILRDLVSEFKQAAQKRNLELLFETKQEDHSIFADNYTITQIFANLIHNSIKYTTEGYIKISIFKNNQGEIQVEIKDTGVGMSEEYQEKIFDPFSQEETGYTRKFEGTGLGLTLVRKYCELNNAEIIVESTKNIGTTFIVRFKN